MSCSSRNKNINLFMSCITVRQLAVLDSRLYFHDGIKGDDSVNCQIKLKHLTDMIVQLVSNLSVLFYLE